MDNVRQAGTIGDEFDQWYAPTLCIGDVLKALNGDAIQVIDKRIWRSSGNCTLYRFRVVPQGTIAGSLWEPKGSYECCQCGSTFSAINPCCCDHKTFLDGSHEDGYCVACCEHPKQRKAMGGTVERMDCDH